MGQTGAKAVPKNRRVCFHIKMNGLVLTAGGARGAYQAGVLKRMGEIPRLRDRPSPFPIVTGASAGAINGASIASGSDDFSSATRHVAELWGKIEAKDVFKTDPFSLGAGSARWLRDLSMGGLFGGGGGAQSLLDFSPLRNYLSKNLSFEGIGRAIDNKHLYAVAISATSYYSGKSFTFIQGQSGHPLWRKSRRASLSIPLNVDHIWASCAIPIIFQPVKISLPIGDFYFGDGGLRLITPFSPAIRLGADRVFAIGIRSQKSAEMRSKNELLETDQPGAKTLKMKRPPLAQVFGVALNSIFLDHLDTDLEHLMRMNEILKAIDPKNPPKTREPMKIVKAFAVNPSVDLASFAEQFSHKMPRLVSYFLEGLGQSKAQSADLMSYLLFDSSYTQALMDVGYKDAGEHIPEIEDLIFGS
jgi:NTE family protein